MTKHAFTPDQQKAIYFSSHEHSQKPHLVIEAGAGAGKTQVLTERVKWLVQGAPLEKRISPYHLFLVTFTNDAQLELKERVEQSIGSQAVSISTIDSLFAMLVDCLFPSYWEKKQFQNTQIPPAISLIPEDAACRKMEKSLLHFLNGNGFHPTELSLVVDFILAGGFQKSNFLFPSAQSTMDTILKYMCQDTFLTTEPQNIRIAAQNIHPATAILLEQIHKIARQEYENRLLQGEMTYSDRTVFLKENLTDNTPLFLKELIVDEYQDTNHIQHEILFRIVTASRARMVVVGDPKQSIYGFRGASVDVFQNLTEDPAWNHIVLDQNFRSQAALLEQINLLSKIAFQWSNPKNPQEYQNSFFHTQAAKKHIPAKPLVPKDTPFSSPENSSVHLVTSSLSSEKKSKLKLKDHSLNAYCDFLKKFKFEHNVPWNDIVILCEKNKQIQDFIPILQAHHIPISNYDEHKDDSENSFEDLVSLSLCKYLTGVCDKFDLYVILESPLSPCTHSEVESFFAHEKKSESLNLFLNCLEEHKDIAKDNFFLAWQLLRWKLVSLHENKETQKNAFLFCSHMDSFAHALFEELKNPNTRVKMECGTSFFPLPENLKNWDIPKMTQQRRHGLIYGEDSNGIEIKTVHKAKGLQWPYVCFYPKYGKYHSTGEFILAQSGKYIDVTWLNQDVEKLSMAKRIENPKFQHLDFCTNEKEKKIWFSILRKQSEEDFERQRVFYTAFTRAEKKLVLFQPAQAGNAKSGVADFLKKSSKKSNSFSREDYLEKDVYVKYLMSEEQKADVVHYTAASLPELLSAESDDFFIEPAEKITRADTHLKCLFPVIENPQKENEPPEHTQMDTHPNVFSTLEEKIRQKQNQMQLIHKGVVYHAAAENKKASQTSFQYDLERMALASWHELEIWHKQDPASMNSSRHIIDLLLLFSREKFLTLFAQFENRIQQPHVVFIVDFKTGQKEEKHTAQIKKYIELAKLTQNWSHDPSNTTGVDFMGCVFYSKTQTVDFIF